MILQYNKTTVHLRRTSSRILKLSPVDSTRGAYANSNVKGASYDLSCPYILPLSCHQNQKSSAVVDELSLPILYWYLQSPLRRESQDSATDMAPKHASPATCPLLNRNRVFLQNLGTWMRGPTLCFLLPNKSFYV